MVIIIEVLNEKDLEILLFVKKYKYVKVSDFKYLYANKQYYQTKIKHLINNNYLRKIKWYIVLGAEGKKYLELISEDMFAFFRKLEITGDDKPLVIVGGMPVPRFCAAEKNNIPFNMVHLTMQAYTYWCQVVFQLSHELTHYMIYSHCKDESNYASWIEETICEAMSLYFLEWYRDNWEELSLYKYNAVYDKKVGEYLEDELRKEGTERLSRCGSYQELIEIDRTSQNCREDRRTERNKLFSLIYERDIKGMIYYRDYIIPNSKILDCDRYLQDFPFSAPVKYLCDLQTNILTKAEHGQEGT